MRTSTTTVLFKGADLPALAILSLVSVAQAQVSPEESFRSEAPAAWTKVLAQLANSSMELESRRDYFEVQGGARTEADIYVVKATGNRMLLDRTRLPNAKQPEPGTVVFCLNDKTEFNLRRSGQEPWMVLKMGPPTASTQTRLDGDAMPALQTCLWMLDRPIYRMFAEEGFVLKRAEASDSAGRKAVRAYFDYQPPEGEISQIVSGWVDLLPAMSWVIGGFEVRGRESKNDTVGQRVIRGDYQYDARSEPARPVITGTRYEFTTPRDGEMVPLWTYQKTFKKFKYGPVAVAEFEPAAYGVNIPGATDVVVSPWRRAAIWITVAIILGLLSAWFYQRSRRMAPG